MLFREPSLTSLRRDSTRIQNGRFATGSPSPFSPSLSLPLPLPLPLPASLSLSRSLALSRSLSLSLARFASRNVDLCPTLPLPMDLHPDIYYSQYYRAHLYCVSRNAFTSKRLGPFSLLPLVSFSPGSIPSLDPSRSMRSAAAACIGSRLNGNIRYVETRIFLRIPCARFRTDTIAATIDHGRTRIASMAESDGGPLFATNTLFPRS